MEIRNRSVPVEEDRECDRSFAEKALDPAVGLGDVDGEHGDRMRLRARREPRQGGQLHLAGLAPGREEMNEDEPSAQRPKIGLCARKVRKRERRRGFDPLSEVRAASARGRSNQGNKH
jgi:hypothetical protein